MSCDRVMQGLAVRLGSDGGLFSVHLLTCQACLSYDSLPTVMWHCCAVTHYRHCTILFAKRCQKRSFLTLNIGHQFNTCSEAKISVQTFDHAEKICSYFPDLSWTHPQPQSPYHMSKLVYMFTFMYFGGAPSSHWGPIGVVMATEV